MKAVFIIMCACTLVFAGDEVAPDSKAPVTVESPEIVADHNFTPYKKLFEQKYKDMPPAAYDLLLGNNDFRCCLYSDYWLLRNEVNKLCVVDEYAGGKFGIRPTQYIAVKDNTTVQTVLQDAKYTGDIARRWTVRVISKMSIVQSSTKMSIEAAEEFYKTRVRPGDIVLILNYNY